MAKVQGYSTGGGSFLGIASVDITTTGIKLAAASNIASITNINDFKYDKSDFLELAIFSSSDDQVGIVSTSTSLDAAPKTITFNIDREDTYSMRFMQRYARSLRPGLETPAGQSTTAKEYEDGLSVRGEAGGEEEAISPADTVFFVWLGPALKGGKRKIVYGLAGVSSSSPNFSTSFEQDNQFTFTLTGAPQKELDFVIPDTGADSLIEYVFNSAIGANFGTVGGPQGLDKGATSTVNTITDGKLGAIFEGYKFKIPALTSIIVDEFIQN